MSEPVGLPKAVRRREALRRKIPRIHLYQLPGYGKTYRAWQTFIHNHGRCVLREGGPMDDGAVLWRCSWCGHTVTESARRAQLRPALRRNDLAEVARLERPPLGGVG